MNLANANQMQAQHLANRNKDQEERGKRRSKGLLSRMYPGLSREQAAAVVRQQIMLERLRQAARSRKRRR